MGVQEHGLPLAKAGLATTIAKHPTCQKHKLTPHPQYGTISQGVPSTIWWQVNYTGGFLPWKGQQLILTGINTYRCGFAFFASTTFWGITVFHPQTWNPIWLCISPGECKSGHMTIISTGPCQPAKGIEWPLKEPLRPRLGDDNLWGWGIILQVAGLTLNQLPLCGTVSPAGRTHGSEKRGEVGVAVFVITISDCWEFVLSVRTTLDSVGLEILYPRGKPLPPGTE